jgi:hypothetical protein
MPMTYPVLVMDTAAPARPESFDTFVAVVRPGQTHVRRTIDLARLAEILSIWADNEAIGKAGR